MAFLQVPRFKHGIRSLEALIRTSRLAPGNAPLFHWGALPPREQLEMHVSWHEFEEAARRARSDDPAATAPSAAPVGAGVSIPSADRFL